MGLGRVMGCDGEWGGDGYVSRGGVWRWLGNVGCGFVGYCGEGRKFGGGVGIGVVWAWSRGWGEGLMYV